MVSFEKALFDTNEALHHMGVFPADKNITLTSMIISLVVIFSIMPLIVKSVNYLASKDPKQIYTPLFSICSMLVILLLVQAYYAILGAFIAGGLYYIVVSYPQYSDIKNYINRFF